MTLDGDFTPEEFDKARRMEEEFPTRFKPVHVDAQVYADVADPTPRRGADTRFRQSLLREQCSECGKWVCVRHDGHLRKHRCIA